jgi:hypothetical protein
MKEATNILGRFFRISSYFGAPFLFVSTLNGNPIAMYFVFTALVVTVGSRLTEVLQKEKA